VDHEELISTEVGVAANSTETKGSRRRIADEALADVFGIELSDDVAPAKTKPSARRKKAAPKSKAASKAAAKGTVKRQGKTGKRKPIDKKPRTSRQPKRQDDVRAAQGAHPVTGKAVARLRAKFGLSQSEFARLLGVSAPTIGNWEKKPGALGLQSRSLNAWNTAKRLTRRQARRKLDGT
jgi:DNA-binding transcriptional regulator YiaG